jgi:hypothetical protein
MGFSGRLLVVEDFLFNREWGMHPYPLSARRKFEIEGALKMSSFLIVFTFLEVIIILG